MNTNTKKILTQEEIDAKLAVLLGKIKNVGDKIDEVSKDSNQKLDDIDRQADESVAALEKTFADLDHIEKEAGDELDALSVEYADISPEE